MWRLIYGRPWLSSHQITLYLNNLGLYSFIYIILISLYSSYWFSEISSSLISFSWLLISIRAQRKSLQFPQNIFTSISDCNMWRITMIHDAVCNNIQRVGWRRVSKYILYTTVALPSRIEPGASSFEVSWTIIALYVCTICNDAYWIP